MFKKISLRFKNSLLTGIIVSAPIFITIAVFWYVLYKLDNLLGGIFAYFIQLPGGGRIPGIGIIALIVIIFLVGELTRKYIGRKILNIAERIFTRIPVLRIIYNALKQLGNYIMATRKANFFKKVILVEWPNPESYIIAFLTDDKFDSKSDDEMVSVYVPTAPNPTSGYLLYVHKAKLVNTSLTIEEGMRIVLSAGLVDDPTKYLIPPIIEEKIDSEKDT